MDQSKTDSEVLGELLVLRRRVLELEARLDEREDQERDNGYRALFENTPDAILIIAGDRFIDCNDATVRMLRYRDKAELLQTHPSELSPELQPDGRRSYEKANEMMAIAIREGSHRFEWDHRRADGEVFPVEVLLTVVPKDDGFVLHTVWRDITERKRLEEELRHAQKMEAVGKLAGGVAHDFNNLLVAILGYSDLLITQLEDHPDLSREAREIQRAAEHAASLTAQLLAFSRKQVLQARVIDLGAAVGKLDKMLRRIIGEDVRLRFDAPEEQTCVKVDRGQIEQLVLNLVTNARDAMEGGGTLTVAISVVSVREGSGFELPDGRYALLRVTDTGAGMTSETIRRAFDPFFTTKERGRGTGLGLATTYGIVKQSGGDIRIESEPGLGTSVRVLLPLSAEPPEEPPPRPLDLPVQRAGATILVVEDEAVVAGLIRRVLLGEGYRIIEARDGLEALAIARRGETPFDLLLTDVVMPHMSGAELVRSLPPAQARQPVLFMSGYTDNDLAKHGFELAHLALLRKPFTPSELLASVRRVLTMASAETVAG